ncbi:MAG: mechanosensitive ion channel family protein [Clostridiales bacterium]|nr:mechanosensitive ion channel family protein [Clostridiales bacterium]
MGKITFKSITDGIGGSGGAEYLGTVALQVALIIVIGLIAIKIVLAILRKGLKKSNLDPVLFKFVVNSIKVVLLIVVITMCLGALGVSMSTLIAVIGAAGAAVALAMKDSLANIAGGMMIIITKPFKRDDLIDIGEVSGKVKSIDLFLTTLLTLDNRTITIPNGLINTSILINRSREAIRRVDCKFGIGYDSDITKAKEILQNICVECPDILDEPRPSIGVSEQGDSAVIIEALAWCSTENYFKVKYFLEEKVKVAFDEQDINIPYPHVTVKLTK